MTKLVITYRIPHLTRIAGRVQGCSVSGFDGLPVPRSGAGHALHGLFVTASRRLLERWSRRSSRLPASRDST